MTCGVREDKRSLALCLILDGGLGLPTSEGTLQVSNIVFSVCHPFFFNLQLRFTSEQCQIGGI